MKNKHFILILVGIVSIMIVTFTLQMLFEEQTTEFGLSCGIFFVSIFCLFAYKNALKPREPLREINHTKRYYEKRGQLSKYKNLCKILFFITVGVGALTFFCGVWAVIFYYLEAWVEKA